jgi:DNA invertase Pin-like site-specific DNA recombinase
MKLEFNCKYKNYELRAVPKRLVRFSEDEENHTIKLIKWNTKEDGKKYCFTIAYWVYKEGYELRFVGNRMFEFIDDEDVHLIWQQLKLAQKVLDKFELEEVFEEFID